MEPTTRDVFPWQPHVGRDPLEPDPIEFEDQPIEDEPGLLPSGFIEWFVVAQTAIPAMMFLPGSQVYRLPIRVGAYAITLRLRCSRSPSGGSPAEANATCAIQRSRGCCWSCSISS